MITQKWEYNLIQWEEGGQELLNDLGRQGWELVSAQIITGEFYTTVAIFKRPYQHDPLARAQEISEKCG